MKSLKQGYPCRADGTIVPWMNYAIVFFLEERLKKDLKLFEFGSGYSTLFYANLVHSVTSVESDERWFTTIKDNIPSNAQLIFQEEDENGDYCRAAIQAGQLYDVIVVDGLDRVNCVRQSMEALTELGVILLDDSEREEYGEAFELTAQYDFRALTFEGLKPNDLELRRSTIFYRDNNCFHI
jgi:tRNA A58 N-methylase Trm61